FRQLKFQLAKNALWPSLNWNLMISTEKLAANQANAQFSTGPKTPEGKARSAVNSRTHGLCAKEILVAAKKKTVCQLGPGFGATRLSRRGARTRVCRLSASGRRDSSRRLAGE